MLVQIYLYGEIVGQIFQEVPELYPNDWTLSIDTMQGNLVSTLEKCIKATFSERPNCSVLITKGN